MLGLLKGLVSNPVGKWLMMANLVAIAGIRCGLPGFGRFGFIVLIINLPARAAAFLFDSFASGRPPIPSSDTAFGDLETLLFVAAQWLVIGSIATFAAKRLAERSSELFVNSDKLAGDLVRQQRLAERQI